MQELMEGCCINEVVQWRFQDFALGGVLFSPSPPGPFPPFLYFFLPLEVGPP